MVVSGLLLFLAVPWVGLFFLLFKKFNRLTVYKSGLCIRTISGALRFVTTGPPGVWGIWGECLFIFRNQGSKGNYFRGVGEQAHSIGDLGSSAKICLKGKK